MIVRGILRDYNSWVHYGERKEHASSTDDDKDDELLYKGDGLFAQDDMTPLVREATKVYTYDISENDVNNTATGKGSNDLPKEFSNR